MKKLFVLAVVASFGLASCKKDYTCACKFTNGETLNIAITKAKKKDAEDTCKSAETTYKVGDSGVTCGI